MTDPAAEAVEALERLAEAWSDARYQNVMLPGTIKTCGELAPYLKTILAQIASLKSPEQSRSGEELKLPSQEWLSRHVETDPDIDCEAGSPQPSEGGEGELERLRAELARLKAPGGWRELAHREAQAFLGDPAFSVNGMAQGFSTPSGKGKDSGGRPVLQPSASAPSGDPGPQQPRPAIEPPWPVGPDNAKREGWHSYFSGKARGTCPFPPARDDLRRDYQIGWDTAEAAQRAADSEWFHDSDMESR